MIYMPTRPRPSLERVAQRSPKEISQRVTRNRTQSRFLIVGCDSGLCRDQSAGTLVAETVNSWQLELTSAIVVSQLSPTLILQLVEADYVIIVEPCMATNRTCTMQVQPLTANGKPNETTYVESEQCSPQMLMSLMHRIYGTCPLVWSFKIPTDDAESSGKLSSMTKTGVDRAVQTITQFLRTYQ